MVCERARSDDGGDPRPGGVPDGFTVDGEGPGFRGDAAQEANWSDVCVGRYAGNEGAVLAFHAEVYAQRDETLSRTDVPDWGSGLVRSGGVLQLVEQARGDRQG